MERVPSVQGWRACEPGRRLGLCLRRLRLCVFAEIRGLSRSNEVVTGASDAQYHVMWISLFNALDEYGIRDDSLSPNEVQDVKQKVFEEALNASLRVSALVSILNPPYLPTYRF